MKEIPGEIGNLVHLRHLDLHSNEELKKLPESICSLVELQILNIEGCGIMPLPEGISKLENLQHILSGAFLGHLSYLFTLRWSLFRGGNGCNKLGLLKNLNRLTKALSLRIHFSSATDLKELAKDAQEAKLRNKIHIHMLHMLFIDDDYEKKQSSSSSSSASSLWIDVIEALEPNQKLKDLTVEGYKGSKLPHWFSSPLKLIKLIYLVDLSELSSLPSMGKLPFLEILVMDKLKKLKLVGREFLGIECSSSSSSSRSKEVVVFPKLEKLIFDECPNWSEWEDITEEEVHEAISIMTRLTELRVISCGGLTKLPLRLLRKARSLEMLYILRSQQLIARYAHDPRWNSKFQNPKLSLLF